MSREHDLCCNAGRRATLGGQGSSARLQLTQSKASRNVGALLLGGTVGCWGEGGAGAGAGAGAGLGWVARQRASFLSALAAARPVVLEQPSKTAVQPYNRTAVVHSRPGPCLRSCVAHGRGCKQYPKLKQPRRRGRQSPPSVPIASFATCPPLLSLPAAPVNGRRPLL